MNMLILAQSGGGNAMMWVVVANGIVALVTLASMLFQRKGEVTPEQKEREAAHKEREIKVAHDIAQSRQEIQSVGDNITEQIGELKVKVVSLEERGTNANATAAQLMLANTIRDQELKDRDRELKESIKQIDNAIRGNGQTPGIRSCIEKVELKLDHHADLLKQLRASVTALEEMNRADRARVAKGGEPAT